MNDCILKNRLLIFYPFKRLDSRRSACPGPTRSNGRRFSVPEALQL